MAAPIPSLHAHRYGPTGPASILAVHGLTGHGERWATLANRHLPEFAIVAPDLIGHGRSSRDAPWTIEANVVALAALLDGGGAGPVTVVGHSFGGAIALSLAATRPDLVASLVLLDPAVGLNGAWTCEIADAMLASPDFADRDEARADKTSGAWGEVADADPGELERELDAHLVEMAGGRWGWRISVPATMSYWSEITRPSALPPEGTPTTLIRAARTSPPYVTDQLVATLAARLGSAFTLLDFDCDHMVAQAKPAETAAVIRSLAV